MERCYISYSKQKYNQGIIIKITTVILLTKWRLSEVQSRPITAAELGASFLEVWSIEDIPIKLVSRHMHSMYRCCVVVINPQWCWISFLISLSMWCIVDIRIWKKHFMNLLCLDIPGIWLKDINIAIFQNKAVWYL